MLGWCPSSRPNGLMDLIPSRHSYNEKFLSASNFDARPIALALATTSPGRPARPMALALWAADAGSLNWRRVWQRNVRRRWGCGYHLDFGRPSQLAPAQIRNDAAAPRD